MAYDALMSSDWEGMHVPIPPLGCHLEYSNAVADYSVVEAEHTHRLIPPYDIYKTHGEHVYDYLLSLVPKGSVLDLGCGPGQLLLALDRPKNDLYGCTIHVGEAKAAHKAGLTNIAPHDMRAIDEFYFPASFDCVIANWSFNHISMREREETIRKALNLLTPAGIFIGRSYYHDSSTVIPHIDCPYTIETKPSPFGEIVCYLPN